MRVHRQLSNVCRSGASHFFRRPFERLVEAVREAAVGLQVREITRRLRHLQVTCPAGDDMYKCRVCQQRFPVASKLMAHKVYKHSDYQCDPDSLLKCPICKRPCKTENTMSAHLGTHLGERVCKLCGAEFASAGAEAAHELFHPTSGNFACSQCKKPFAQQSGLREHSFMEHGLILPRGAQPRL